MQLSGYSITCKLQQTGLKIFFQVYSLTNSQSGPRLHMYQRHNERGFSIAVCAKSSEDGHSRDHLCHGTQTESNSIRTTHSENSGLTSDLREW